MKLDLEEPFKSIWSKGYVRTYKKDNRKLVDLFNNNKDRTTISYARYLKCVELGYILDSTFEVDHINNDRTDDRLENLQVMSKEEHKVKTKEERKPRSVVELVCTFCGQTFSRFANQDHTKHGYKNSFCSKSCNGKFQRQEQLKQISKE